MPDRPPLGALSVGEFMRRHWQRRPLLIRQAFERFVPPLDVDAVRALACDPDVTSRLVRRRATRWTLEHGPFEPEALPTMRARDWTALLQGVDRHDDGVHRLLRRFRFVADARLDDVMISIAGPGGGVGPHVDSYDVFLLQGHGRRRWRIAPPGDDALRPGLPLKILERFEPVDEWVLEPGDMLYVPPGWGHEGTALDACMTLSIGFRAPSRQEFLRALLAEASDAPGGPDQRFADPGARPVRRPAQVPAAMMATLRGWGRRWRPSAAQVDAAIGRFLTDPPADVVFEPPAPQAAARVAARLRRRGVRLDRRTRLMQVGRRWWINGEPIAPLPAAEARALRRLADTRGLGPAGAVDGLPDLDGTLGELLLQWHADGWVHDGTAG